MKKALYIFAAALSVFLTACNKEQKPTKLTIVESSVDFTNQECKGFIELESGTDIVSAVSDQEWCRTTISKKTVTVRTDANETIESRSASIVISNEAGESVSATVTQKGVRYKFNAQDIDVTKDGGEIEIGYYGEENIMLLLPDDAKSWLSVEICDTAFTFTVQPNETVAVRTAKVGYALMGQSGYFNVKQAAGDPFVKFTPEDTEINITSEPTDTEIEYTTNVTLSVAAADEWISVTQDESKIKIHADLNNSLNPREGTVNWQISQGNAVKGSGSWTIKQAAADKVITHMDVVDAAGAAVTEIAKDAIGGEYSFSIKSNVSWTAASDAEWVVVTPVSDDNADFVERNISVKVTVAANSGAAREATVTITGVEIETPVTISVKQDRYIGVALEVKTVTYEGASIQCTPSGDDFPYVVLTYDTDDFNKWTTKEQIFNQVVTELTAMGAEYEMTLADVVDILAYVGPDVDELTGLDSEAEYTAVAVCFDSEYKPFGDVTSVSYKTLEFPFNYLGKGEYSEDIVPNVFPSYTAGTTCAVDIYESKSTSGMYYVDTPYSAEMFAKLVNIPVEQAEQYENGNWKKVMMEINATNPDSVQLPWQEIGICMNQTYGWFEAGNKYLTYVASSGGKLENGKITFPTKGLMTAMTLYSSIWYANGSGKFYVTIPTASTTSVKAAPKRVTTRKMHVSGSKMPHKTFNAKDFHIMSVDPATTK